MSRRLQRKVTAASFGQQAMAWFVGVTATVIAVGAAVVRSSAFVAYLVMLAVFFALAVVVASITVPQFLLKPYITSLKRSRVVLQANDDDVRHVVALARKARVREYQLAVLILSAAAAIAVLLHDQSAKYASLAIIAIAALLIVWRLRALVVDSISSANEETLTLLLQASQANPSWIRNVLEDRFEARWNDEVRRWLTRRFPQLSQFWEMSEQDDVES